MLMVDGYFPKKAPEGLPFGVSFKDLWNAFVKGPKANGCNRERSSADADFLAYKREVARGQK